MKLFHISDLHIGKQLNGYNLRENQEMVLDQIIQYAKEQHPDVILICGDIYDKTAPSGEAYLLFDAFLDGLSQIRPKVLVLMIAGNHDSPERLSYASAFLEKHNIFMSVMPPQKPEEYLKKVVLEDEYGPVNFYLLPFLKPGYVRPLFGEDMEEGYEGAVKAVICRETVDTTERNVLLSHQFYTAGSKDPSTCESEQAVIMAGGLERIDASVLSAFDYAALGHLHGPQRVGRDSVRYCGTPYKYSVSEEHHNKSVTMVQLGEKGTEIQIECLPLKGSQDVRRVKGTLQEILEGVTEENRHDFVSVTITDEEEPYHIREQLEEAFDHLLELRVDNTRTRSRLAESKESVPVLYPMEAFAQFYEAVRHTPLQKKEEEIMAAIVQEAKEEEGL